MVLKREPTRVVADSAPRQGPKKAQQPQVDGIGGYDVAEEE